MLATFSPVLGETSRRILPQPVAIAPAPISPLPADRARIEALVFSLIDWLDAQDAALADMEPDADSENSHDAELSEPGDDLAARMERLGMFYRDRPAQVRL